MTLAQGSAQVVISHNIKKLMREGKTRKEAEAIALAESRKTTGKKRPGFAGGHPDAETMP